MAAQVAAAQEAWLGIVAAGAWAQRLTAALHEGRYHREFAAERNLAALHIQKAWRRFKWRSHPILPRGGGVVTMPGPSSVLPPTRTMTMTLACHMCEGPSEAFGAGLVLW